MTIGDYSGTNETQGDLSRNIIFQWEIVEKKQREKYLEIIYTGRNQEPEMMAASAVLPLRRADQQKMRGYSFETMDLLQ